MYSSWHRQYTDVVHLFTRNQLLCLLGLFKQFLQLSNWKLECLTTSFSEVIVSGQTRMNCDRSRLYIGTLSLWMSSYPCNIHTQFGRVPSVARIDAYLVDAIKLFSDTYELAKRLPGALPLRNHLHRGFVGYKTAKIKSVQGCNKDWPQRSSCSLKPSTFHLISACFVSVKVLLFEVRYWDR